MKDNNLYFILLLIAILVFTCLSKQNMMLTDINTEEFSNHSLENSQNHEDFILNCTTECTKKGKHHEICQSQCSNIIDNCENHNLGSCSWWKCANNINSEVDIPSHCNKGSTSEFVANCTSGCVKEGNKTFETCEKQCETLNSKCNFYKMNSYEWWECLNKINPNIVIPNYLKPENNNLPPTPSQINNYDPDMETYLNNISNPSYNIYNNNKLNLEEEGLMKEEALIQSLRNNGSQIPVGEKNKYILKSQIVPPVCPACPEVNCGNCKTECQPCPPCARCPEPSFECKKVPNYKEGPNNPYLPIPWLNSFSQFS